ncbi:MAG: DUF5115 domain-containing protein [Prevotella sp.]|nr:DUF5115 domain-containing protein [Prevotella sp.]
MKKISLYIMALLSTGLVSCNQDFETIFSPQTNPQESLLQASDVTVANNTPAVINLAEYFTEDGIAKAIPIGAASVKEGAMPANTILKAEVEFSKDADFGNSIVLDANSLDGSSDISVSASLLQDAYFNEITRNPATTDLYIRTVLYTVTGGTSDAIVGKPGENYYAESKVQFTPLNKVQISPAYYIIGGPNDWAGSAAEKPIKFNHSGADVYEDPIFTVVFDAAAEGDTWFAIGDDEACEAIGNGDWTKLLGIVGGDSQSKEGRLDYRYNLGADNSFCVPAGAKKIKVTIDMLNYTFKVEPVSIADAYYLIGGPGEWGAESAMTMQFTHSSADVFEDPVFTYVFAGNGGEGDIWFAFGDKDAIDAVAAGDWTQLYGTTGESTDLSGGIDRRYNLGGDHSFCVDGKAKFYRLQINMAEMTYAITALDFDPYVYFIGATDGWTNAEQKLALTDESGIYTGYLYCADPNGWGNEFKFQKIPGDWDSQLNSGTFTGGISGDFADGGDNIKANAGEGVYYVTLDLANLTLNAVKVEKMGIIGDFNGWSDDVDMTWNADDYCFEATAAGVNENGWKFRINADWGVNLGGKTVDNLEANGDNLTVVGNTIKLYPTRKNSDNIYCTVE